jgi:hypothetical protein
MIEDDDDELYWVCLNSLKSSIRVSAYSPKRCVYSISFLCLFFDKRLHHTPYRPYPFNHAQPRPQLPNDRPNRNSTPHILGQVVVMGFPASQARKSIINIEGCDGRANRPRELDLHSRDEPPARKGVDAPMRQHYQQLRHRDSAPRR